MLCDRASGYGDDLSPFVVGILGDYSSVEVLNIACAYATVTFTLIGYSAGAVVGKVGSGILSI